MRVQLTLFKEETKQQKQTDPNSSHYKFIVDNFLVDFRKNVYIHQLKLAKKLFAHFPDPDFWKFMTGECEKIYTLKDLLTPEKLQWLKIKSEKRKLDFKPTVEHTLSEDFFYELGNESYAPKPKTKTDFINYESDEDK
tara:strand:+ start:7972 stop:8385 length:414 start_codon:yes stop_codon:yes gene_type:complete